MNVVTPIVPRAPRRRRSDHEFLAPALEIIETPASPIKLALILVISACFIGGFAWSYFGQIDIIATAQGKIEPTGKVKIVQPQQTGQINRILVKDGDRVAEGAVVAELDPVGPNAEVTDLREQLASQRAQVLRRRAGLQLTEAWQPGIADLGSISIEWASDIPAGVRDREEGILRQDVRNLEAELASSQSQIRQRQANLKATDATVAAQVSLVDTLQQLSQMREALVAKNAGSQADWLNTLQAQKLQEVTLATDQGEATDALASIDVLLSSESKDIAAFRTDYMQKLADAQGQADDTAQKLAQAEEILSQMTLTSPASGVVEASAITSIGQVVTPGEEVMRILPTGAALEIQAYLSNEDIGFVQVGQPAVVKVSAFPFTQYGTLSGRVLAVGRDALTAADAQQASEDPSRAPVGANGAGAAEATSNLVFPITVQLDQDAMTVEGHSVRLLPGMGVTVEINTGNRRIIEFLFSPVVGVSGSAFHER